MLNILIVGKNLNYCNSLLNYISQNDSQIRVYSITDNIYDGINILNTGFIDVALIDEEFKTDIVLKNSLNLEKYKKSILLFSNTRKVEYIYCSQYIYECILPREEMSTILNTIHKIAPNQTIHSNNSFLMNKINKELEYIGYNLSYNGTKYLSESIALLYTNYNISENLSQSIYPIIAKKHNKTVNNIKCNITKATNSMFYECEEDRLKDYFNFYLVYKPKPKQVIYTVLNKLYKSI